ncbi:hypothetical protein HELRODRAFT_105295 [Helobdella robusta]|uniref:G-protein coupled receptors family 3 profile domain-containing protein n=1 Tax=Helobdella robusta TaxID=6412 RepID=T1EDT4_HELRO|nr:hypothetical protein HELRODRAFT_105295 [Helobdella robusta]ESO12355.1 hypothetical protein HELRODRAFT_105295 [Helobdella robusta]
MRQIFEKLKLKHEPQSKNFKAICNESRNVFDSMRSSNEMKMWGDLSYDCLTKRWRVLRIEPLYQCVNSSLPPLSGMIKFDIHLDELALDPCSVSKPNSIFQHKCPAHSQCISSQLKTKWKRTSSYACKCLKGYYNKYFMQINLSKESTELNSSNCISGHLMDQTYVDKLLNRSIRWDFECVPCAAGCEECVNDRACNLSFDVLNRGVPLAVESISLTICTALFCSIFKLRKTKVMKGSIWFLLETVVFGAFLLYTTVIIRYFEPNNCLCIVVQWFREVGFACVYGSLILKVYRVLTEFQSRKAHRVQMRNKDLIKCLICIVVVVVGYMAAWTAVNIDSMDGHDWSMLWTVYKDGLKFELCRTVSWDFVIILAEILFLSFGIRLCYRARSAPSSHKEIFCITFALCNEIVISGLFYTLRHFLVKQLHPDHLFLMYFLRCQLTVSTLLAAVVGPKLWFAHQPLDDMTLRNRAYSSSEHEHSSPEVVKLNIKPNGDLDNGEFLLTEFNPEDIRYELKRLYTQLQIYKTKTMRQDNPHIPKRRGGRKQTHRRFSLQAFHNKHKRPHSDHGNVSSSGGGGETEVSRTPEESTNSAEGVSVYMDECSALESNNNNNFNNNVNIATNSASRIFTGIVKSKRKNSELNK